ncbi:hypothetical protein SprV_0902655600 [Sparganum proliferum]
MDRKVEEIQVYADRNETNHFSAPYQGSLRPLFQMNRTAAQLRPDNTPHGEISNSKTSGRAHQSSLNRPSTITDADIGRLPQVETNTDLDLPSPPLSEAIRYVLQLSGVKTPGSDATPISVYTHGGPD